MLFELWACKRSVDCKNYQELIGYKISMEAVGVIPFGPTRRIEAATEDEAKDIFLDTYGNDFDLIGCREGDVLCREISD